jgi:hypothetical protein
MALSNNDLQNIEREQSGLLDVNATDYYFKNLRPELMKFNTTYHTDRELNRTITEVINHADTAVVNKNFQMLEESYANLLSCVQSKNYMISGPMRYGSDEEKKAVNELVNKFNDLSMILKYEKQPEKEEHEIKDRLNYQPPNGGNRGYNLDDLSNRGPKPNKERIPNPINQKEKYAF